MGFFNSDTGLAQAEQILEDYMLNFGKNDYYLRDIPLSPEDCDYIMRKVSEYTRNAYNFDDYQQILLLFIMNGYLRFKTSDTKNIFKELFLNNASNIPQHHMRHLVQMISSMYTEFDIYTFGEKCNTLESVMNVIKRHAEA